MSAPLLLNSYLPAVNMYIVCSRSKVKCLKKIDNDIRYFGIPLKISAFSWWPEYPTHCLTKHETRFQTIFPHQSNQKFEISFTQSILYKCNCFFSKLLKTEKKLNSMIHNFWYQKQREGCEYWSWCFWLRSNTSVIISVTQIYDECVNINFSLFEIYFFWKIATFPIDIINYKI